MPSPQADPQLVDGTDGQRPVHTLKEVTAEHGDVDLGDQDGVVEGDVLRGGVVRGGGDLHIVGSLKGEPDHACRIEVSGDVRVDGASEQSRIRARRIGIGRDVVGGRLTSDLDVEVGGDLSDAEASIGNRAQDLSRLLTLKAEYDRLETQMDEMRVKVGSTSRRFVRDYPQVDLAMGGIIVPHKREVRVDLASFYKAVADRTPDEIDKALQEFYVRVMVGALTRSNRLYVSRNPSRQKIFLKLIEDLRGHVMNVRAADRLQAAAGDILQERQMLLDDLKRPVDSAVKVAGKVTGETKVLATVLGPIEGTAAGAIDVGKTQLEARLTEGEGGPSVESTDAGGEVHSRSVGEDGLHNGSFRVWDSLVVWDPST